MTYVTVRDLKRTRELWRLLAEQRELIITRRGEPCAILIGIAPEMVGESIREIRRAMFSLAVRTARAATKEAPISPGEIEAEIAVSRTAAQSQGSSAKRE